MSQKTTFIKNMEYLGENIIFLVSQPRSGSTMLQRMLAASSQIYTIAEPWLMLHPIYALREQGISTEYDEYYARLGINEYLSTLPEKKDAFDKAVRAYAHVLYSKGLEGKSENYILDKTPRYYFIINDLISIFPSARFLLLKRNPLAVFASILHTWVKEDLHRLVKHKADLIRAIDCLLQVGEERKGLGWVKYETLVEHPERELKRICQELDLKFETGMIEYGRFAAPAGSMGDPIHAKELKRPVTQFIERWRHTLHTSPSYWFLANVYLEMLGEKRIESWGYSYAYLWKNLNCKSYRLNSEERLQCKYIIKEMFGGDLN